MIFAIIDGIPHIYHSWDEVHAATFSPDIDYKIHVLKVYGRTYKERREHLRQLAINIQALYPRMWATYDVIATLQDFFSRNGKKYGLLSEFKQNGII